MEWMQTFLLFKWLGVCTNHSSQKEDLSRNFLVNILILSLLELHLKKDLTVHGHAGESNVAFGLPA